MLKFIDYIRLREAIQPSVDPSVGDANNKIVNTATSIAQAKPNMPAYKVLNQSVIDAVKQRKISPGAAIQATKTPGQQNQQMMRKK